MYYLIGSLKKKDRIWGYRLFNLKTYITLDLNFNEVHLLAQSNQIINAKIEKIGEISFTQGSKDRYPYINMEDGKVTNGSKVIVIGKSVDGSKYRIVNILGRLVELTSEELVKIGKQYGLANCTIVEGKDTEYIRVISGELPIIDDIGKGSTFKIGIDSNTGSIIVKLYGYQENIIIKKEDLVGLDSSSRLLIFEPYNLVSKVKTLKIEGDVLLTENSTKWFSGLETLVITGELKVIYSNIFDNCVNLRRVYTKNSLSVSQLFCKNRKLVEIKSEVPITSYREKQFNSKYLDVAKMINNNNNLLSIEKLAFGLNDTAKHLIIPPSVSKLDISAFILNKNLKKLEINSLNTVLCFDRMYYKDFSDLGLSGVVPNGASKYDEIKMKLFDVIDGEGELVIPYGYPTELLTRYVNSNTKITVKDKDTSMEKEERKLDKASMLGINIDRNKVIDTVDDMINFIRAYGIEKYFKGLANLYRHIVKNDISGHIKYNVNMGDVILTLTTPGRLAGTACYISDKIIIAVSTDGHIELISIANLIKSTREYSYDNRGLTLNANSLGYYSQLKGIKENSTEIIVSTSRGKKVINKEEQSKSSIFM